MKLNADFTSRVVVHAAKEPWRPSPMAGVDRRMLDRIGDEVARATTIVRYAPGSHFSAHTHSGGEEFIVLDGTFQDEHGDYPTGTYVRNPPSTSHTPGAEDGCIIFVKLWQFDMEDRIQFRKDMNAELGVKADGVAHALLHEDTQERVHYFDASPGAAIELSESGGTELLVIDGSLREGNETLFKDSWLRLPDGAALSATAGDDGAKVWIKTGHLVHAKAPNV